MSRSERTDVRVVTPRSILEADLQACDGQVMAAVRWLLGFFAPLC